MMTSDHTLFHLLAVQSRLVSGEIDGRRRDYLKTLELGSKRIPSPVMISAVMNVLSGSTTVVEEAEEAKGSGGAVASAGAGGVFPHPDTHVVGENGHLALRTEACGDEWVALDTEMVRKATPEHTRRFMETVLFRVMRERGEVELLARYLAYLRDPRNGKGERDLF